MPQIGRIICFCVCFSWNFKPSKAWNFNPSKAWKQLFVIVFRRVEISSFKRVESKRKSRWFKLLSFYRSQNVLGWSKKIFTYCGSHKHFLPDKKMICVQWNFLCWYKKFEEALNVVKFLGWLKKLGLAQNILGPVKGIRIFTFFI